MANEKWSQQTKINTANSDIYICAISGNTGNYTNNIVSSTIFSATGHTHDYLPTSGGTINGSVNASGFIVGGSSEKSVLFSDGEYKPFVDFSLTGHTHEYLPLTGGTVTGTVGVNGIDNDLFYGNASGSGNGINVTSQSGIGASISSNSGDILRLWNETTQVVNVNNEGTVKVSNIVINNPIIPTGETDPSGYIGQITLDNDYIYAKTSSGWKRVIIGGWS